MFSIEYFYKTFGLISLIIITLLDLSMSTTLENMFNPG